MFMKRLSKKITMTDPVFPGNRQNYIRKVNILERDGVETHMVDLFMHNGTHIETGAHYLKGSRHISDFNVRWFVFTNPQVSTLRNLKLQKKKDILLLNTEGEYIDERLAQDIINYDYKCISVDSLSISDPDDMKTGIFVHKILLGNEMFIIEDTKEIEMILYKRIYAIPMIIEGVEASPCTLIGEY